MKVRTAKHQSKKAIKAALILARTHDAEEVQAKALQAAYQHGFEDCAVEAEALRQETAKHVEVLRKKAEEASKGWWEKLVGWEGFPC